MLSTGFVVAMRSTIDLAPYDQPGTLRRRIRKWLIVSRWGAHGEYLTVSLAQSDADPKSEETPLGLAPRLTALGILLWAAQDRAQAVFLFVRHLPPGLRIAGIFFPADGYARLGGESAEISLSAEGRHAHTRGGKSGHTLFNDVPNPAPGFPGAIAWHIAAMRQRWAGEFVADDNAGHRNGSGIEPSEAVSLHLSSSRR